MNDDTYSSMAENFCLLLKQEMARDKTVSLCGAPPSQEFYYQENHLESLGLFEVMGFTDLLGQADMMTASYNGGRVDYHEADKVNKAIEQAAFLWGSCQNEHLGKWGSQQLKVLFDTKTLSWGELFRAISVLETLQSQKDVEDCQPHLKEVFDRGNRWQQEAMVYFAGFKSKWMLDQASEALRPFLIKQAIPKPTLDDTYLLGYGDAETLNTIIKRNNELAQKIFQHHGFLFFRDYPVLETILTNDVLTLDKIKPTELLKYCLFGLNLPFKETKDKRNFYYSDIKEAIGRIQQHRPDIFAQALRQCLRGRIRQHDFLEDLQSDISFLGRYFKNISDETIAWACQDLLTTENGRTLFEKRLFPDTWQTVLEKQALDHAMVGKTGCSRAKRM